MKSLVFASILVSALASQICFAKDVRVICRQSESIEAWTMTAIFTQDPRHEGHTALVVFATGEAVPLSYNVTFQHVVIESIPSFDSFEFELPHNMQAQAEFREDSDVGQGWWKRYDGEMIEFPRCEIK